MDTYKLDKGLRSSLFIAPTGLHEKWFLQLIDSSLRIAVISALIISRDYSYAKITEIRRDRRRGLQIPTGITFRAKLLQLFRVTEFR
jgi:hypothetical protein